MQKGTSHAEAVRLAREKLGNATTDEIASYIREAFGLTIKPAIVTVLLGTLQERQALEASGRAARERIDRWKAENPEEARRLATAVRQREAARRRKLGAAQKETALDSSPRAEVEPPVG